MKLFEALFLAECLSLVVCSAPHSQQIGIPSISSLIPKNKNDKYEILTLRENDQCEGNLACPADASGQLNWQYAQHNYGGSIKVTYNDNGAVNIDIRDNQNLSGPQLVRTTLVIGDGGGGATACHVVVEGAVSLDRTFDELKECGIHTTIQPQLAYREFDVHIHQKFQAGDEKDVHFWGGRIVKVRLYRAIIDPRNKKEEIVVFPLDGKDMNSCEALTHSLTTSPTTPAPNQQSFTVSALNYDPSFTGVGFQLQTCTLTSYWPNGTLATGAQLRIIEEGDWNASPETLLGYSETVPGQSYTITMERLRPLGVDVDANAPALLSCSVCLCKVRVTGVNFRSELNDCPAGIDIVDPDRPSLLKNFVVDDSAQFKAGGVHVVKNVHRKLQTREKLG